MVFYIWYGVSVYLFYDICTFSKTYVPISDLGTSKGYETRSLIGRASGRVSCFPRYLYTLRYQNTTYKRYLRHSTRGRSTSFCVTATAPRRRTPSPWMATAYRRRRLPELVSTLPASKRFVVRDLCVDVVLQLFMDTVAVGNSENSVGNTPVSKGYFVGNAALRLSFAFLYGDCGESKGPGDFYLIYRTTFTWFIKLT